MLLISDSAEGGCSTSERFYKNGKAVGEKEIKDGAGLSNIWEYLGTTGGTD